MSKFLQEAMDILARRKGIYSGYDNRASAGERSDIESRYDIPSSRAETQKYSPSALSSQSRQSGESFTVSPNVAGGGSPALGSPVVSPQTDYATASPEREAGEQVPITPYLSGVRSGAGAVKTGLDVASISGISSPESEALSSALGDVSSVTGYAGTALKVAAGDYEGAAKDVAVPAVTKAVGAAGSYITQEAAKEALRKAAGYTTEEFAKLSAEEIATLAAEEGWSGLGSGMSTAGTMLSGFSTALGYAMPYYALAKLGGSAVDMIVANNPQYKDTPFGALRSVKEPLAVEQWWANELADKGIGTKKLNRWAANSNPLEVGGWISGETDKKAQALYDPAGGLAEAADIPTTVDVGGVTVEHTPLGPGPVVDVGGQEVTVTPLGPVPKGCCVIYTHLYSDDPKKRLTALVFCAKYMTKATLLGYYPIGRLFIKLWERYPRTKEPMVRRMVDPFHLYMRWKLGREKNIPLWPRLFSPFFMGVFKVWYYLGLPRYYPAGYEECVRSAEMRVAARFQEV